MKNFKKILSSQQGLSLIELTVAAAISVIISMGVVKTNQTGQKGMTKLTTDMDLKMWQQQRLMQTLGEPGACANTFPAHSISSSASVPAIRDTQNNIVYSAGDDIEGGAWTINSMSIDAVPAADITPTVNKYTTNLRLVMQRKNKESFGGSTKSIIVPIVMVRASDPSTQLVSCSAGSVGADGLWNQELANGGYIHSASNNVIIGSNGSTPKAPFQIDINSGAEWPGDTENNVFPAMRINTSGDAIVFGAGGGSGAIYQSRPWDGYVPGNCLVMGHGDSGNILSKIESCNQGVRVNSYRSRIDGANATIIGGSNAYANGQFSIATGEKAKAYGSNSFAQGEHTTVTGRNSATFGYGGLVSGANSFGAGYNAHAYGENSIALGSNVLARGRNSVAIGLSSWASADYSTAIGPNAKVAASHYNSMVLSDGYQTNSTAPGQFTAHFRNGFKFITGFSSYPTGSAATNSLTEARSVYIDTNGNMGIGSDLSQSPSSSFTENRKPKLFVNGDTEIYGDLYVNGSKVDGGGLDCAANPIANQASDCYVAGTVRSAQWNSGLFVKAAEANTSNKYVGLYGLSAETDSSHSGWYWGVVGNASHSIAGAGRGFGVYGFAGNSTSGYNIATGGTLNGTGNGAAIYGSLSWPGAVSGRYAGYFAGNIHATGTSTSSDIRLKKDVKNLDNSLDKILKIRGVSYNWINKDDRRGKNKEMGVIAQELELIYPDLVDVVGEKDNVKDAKAVTYAGLIPAIIEAFKEFYTVVMDTFSEQDERLVELEDSNKQLKEQLNSQQELIIEMRHELNQMKLKK